MDQTPQKPKADMSAPAKSIEHMEEEIRELEGMGRPRSGRIIVGLLAVAALVGAYFVFLRPASTERTGVAQHSTGLVIELSQPLPGKLAQPPTHFAWESIAGRSDYLFSLAVEGATKPLVQRAVKNSAADLTPEEVPRLAPGKSYVWRVTARGRDGQVLGSGQSRFELR